MAERTNAKMVPVCLPRLRSVFEVEVARKPVPALPRDLRPMAGQMVLLWSRLALLCPCWRNADRLLAALEVTHAGGFLAASRAFTTPVNTELVHSTRYLAISRLWIAGAIAQADPTKKHMHKRAAASGSMFPSMMQQFSCSGPLSHITHMRRCGSEALGIRFAPESNTPMTAAWSMMETPTLRKNIIP